MYWLKWRWCEINKPKLNPLTFLSTAWCLIPGILRDRGCLSHAPAAASMWRGGRGFCCSDGSDMKNLLGHVGERLGPVGEVSWFAVNYQHIADVAISDAGQSDTWCLILTASEYYFGAVWWWWCCQRHRRWNSEAGMMIMELHLLSWSKMVSQRKKLSDIWILNHLPFWDSIVSDNLV